VKTTEEKLKEEIRWCKEIIARQEKTTIAPEVPEEYEILYGNVRHWELKEHVERLESDLEDLRNERVATAGFELGEEVEEDED